MLTHVTSESLSQVTYNYPPSAKDAAPGHVMTFVVDTKTMRCAGYLPKSSPDLESANDAARRFTKHEPAWIAVVVRKPQIVIGAYYEGLRIV